MEGLQTKTVREIALEMPLSTRVFEEYHIDYCCGGRKPFAEACGDAGVTPEEIEERLDRLSDNSSFEAAERFTEYSLEDLVDHILETHHAYTRTEMIQLTPLMEKVAERHGETHPSLMILKHLTGVLFTDLDSHMRKEEAILFPYVRELASRGNSPSAGDPPLGSVRGPIQVMSAEHDRAGEVLKRMRTVTADYDLPDWACPSFTALFARLEALERDLHQHIHLENNILFPKALELERMVYPLLPF